MGKGHRKKVTKKRRRGPTRTSKKEKGPVGMAQNPLGSWDTREKAGLKRRETPL